MGRTSTFRLSSLLLLQLGIAVWLFLFMQLGVLAFVVPAILATLRVVYGRFDRRLWLLATVLVSTTVLQAYSFVLAYHSHGEVLSAIYLGLFVLQTIPLGLLSVRLPRLAAITSCLLVAMSLPHPLAMGHRLWRAKREARRIARYAMDVRRTTGEYPDALGQYEFQDPAIAGYVRYCVYPETFYVYYHSANANAPHWFSPSIGWGYYPD